MLKRLLQEGIMHLNAINCVQYWPEKLKLAEILFIPKPKLGKDSQKIESYHP